MAKHKYIFQLELDMEDYKILTNYGYYFEGNFEALVNQVANEIREELKKQNDNQNEIN